MKSKWERIYPGWYRNREAANVFVGRYCDCTRSYCGVRYAVFVDRGLGSESVDSSFAASLAEVKATAEELIVNGEL